MKQIIPFKRELLFKTKVSEVTSISLEHELNYMDDIVSGEFHITGDYKMTEGSIQREKFSFDLPFEINLTEHYDKETIVFDIDNFYYELVNNEALKVNIDVSIDGEVIEDKKVDKEEVLERKEEPVIVNYQDDEGIEESIEYKKSDVVNLDDEFNIFSDMESTDTYVTYYVYIVKEGDTIESILDKYGISRDDIMLYNDIDDIRPGIKLIIPNKNE